MTDRFQRLVKGSGRSAAEAAGARLTLAAFGKHPGWDDHIKGIGVETDTLAHIQQSLYDEGIRKQIDSGAWETLDFDKRSEGFDHTFLWLRGSHVVLGQLWSSTDGKGRAKYPMVLCIDGEGVTPFFVLGSLRPGLDRLREACKAAASADMVISNCRAAQDQLREMLSQPELQGVGSGPPANARREFLDRRELGPDGLGWLRVLHELGSVPGLTAVGRLSETATSRGSRSRHLRLPLASDTRSQALLLWTAFLRCAIPEQAPLLLTARRGSPWIDIIIGEPAADDFFCLQASQYALPLATEIPYEIAPELKVRLGQLESKFLGAESPGGPAVPTPPNPSGRAELASAANGNAAVKPAPNSRPWGWFWGGAVFLLAGIGAAWFFLGQHDSSKTSQPPTAQSKPPKQEQAASVTLPQSNFEKEFRDATNLAALALKESKFADATNYAATALKINTNDASVILLLEAAQRGIAAEASTAKEEQQYRNATNLAAIAMKQGKFAEAAAQAVIAQKLRTNDQAAATLMEEARRGMESAASAARQEDEYRNATNLASIALQRGKLEEATAQAAIALKIKAKDPVASSLLEEAKRKLVAAAVAQQVQEQERKIQLASATIPATNLVAVAQVGNDSFTNSLGMEFVRVAGGGGAKPLIGKYEVTQKQFGAVMGKLPEGQIVKEDDLPVANVSFAEANDFCERLSKGAGEHYALPSKEEWLAAAGLLSNQIQNAWAELSAAGALDHEVTSWNVSPPLARPAKIGSHGARTNGLCDVLGNVREWIKEEESAGFYYKSAVGRTKSLFLTSSPSDAWIQQATGFRCRLTLGP